MPILNVVVTDDTAGTQVRTGALQSLLPIGTIFDYAIVAEGFQAAALIEKFCSVLVRSQSKCPIFCFFVCRYPCDDSCGATMHGMRSTTSTPARSSAAILSGLFDNNRTARTPK